VFFYVLSGFVLGQSLSRDSRPVAFVVRRMARLLPAAWVSIALAVAVSVTVAGPPIQGASDWFNGFLSIDTSPAEIARNMGFLSTRINGVLWSIQIEILAIPLLLVGALVIPRLRTWQSLVILAVACIVSPFFLSHYGYCFYIGLLIPRLLAEPLLRPFVRSGALVTLGLFGSICLYTLYICGLLTVQTKYVIDACISAQILAYIAGSQEVAGFLRHRFLVWIGDASYSLYALGQIVLVAVASALFGLLPLDWWTTNPFTFAICLISLNLGLVLPLAWASYRFIEIPGMTLGRAMLRSDGANLSDGEVVARRVP
jgi:peptidoglycan/LPS O-acetylase OafA/YrhL